MTSGTQKKNGIYEVIPGNGYKTLRPLAALELQDPRLFEQEIDSLVSEPFQHFVVNCQNCPSMAKPWIRALVGLARALRQRNMQIRLVCVGSHLEATLKQEGVDSILKTATGLRDALVEFGLATKKAIDTEFINPFLGATILVLKHQAGTEAKPGKIYAKMEKNYQGDVSGVIGIVSESFNGAVVISFPEQTFLNIMSRMLGEKYETLSQELADGAGELLNIIFGQAKVALNAKGYGIQTALPSVVTGKDHAIQTKTNGPIVVIPFETDMGGFFVEICTSD